MNIESFRKICSRETLIITAHGAERLSQRGISVAEVLYTVMHGVIIEEYANDKPYPSCLVLCAKVNGRPIHIVISSDGEEIFLITAYVPDPSKWNENFTERRPQK